MSEDPKLFDAGDYNLFRYCHNDPIDLTDPTGLDMAGPAPTSTIEREAYYNRAMARAQWEGSDLRGKGVRVRRRQGQSLLSTLLPRAWHHRPRLRSRRENKF